MKVLSPTSSRRAAIDGTRRPPAARSIYEPDLKDDALTQAIASSGADVLVVRGTKVTAPMLDAGRLSLIVRAGAGYNTIDVAGASKRGIYVSNCPGKNAIAVAELAFGLILVARSPHSRQRRASCARGSVEQEGILEGAGPLRPDARPARRRQHRPGDDPPRRRLRHERRHLEPPLRRRRSGR